MENSFTLRPRTDFYETDYSKQFYVKLSIVYEISVTEVYCRGFTPKGRDYKFDGKYFKSELIKIKNETE